MTKAETKQAATPEELAEAFVYYADKPVEFAEDILNVKPRPWQREAWLAMQTRKRVSVRSCHGAGKSFALAGLVLWLLVTRPHVKIAITAPTYRQLINVVFRTIGEVLEKSLLKDLVKFKPTQVSFGQNFAIAVTARNPESMAGFHADNMVLIIDEASGVEEAFFDALQGALTTPNAYVWMSGNPTRIIGRFYDSFHKTRAQWHTIKVSAYDLPEIANETNWIEDMAAQYGRESDVFKVRVLGEFPSVNADSLVPITWMEDAIITKPNEALERIAARSEGFIVAADVARFGADSSVINVRQANIIFANHMQQFRGMALNDLAGQVSQLYKKLAKKSPVNPNTKEKILPVVCVDTIGVGAGLHDMLREEGIKAREVVVSETAPDTFPACHRYRDWLYWQCREFFNPEQDNAPIIYAPDARSRKMVDQMIAELAGLTYRYNPAGAIQVETKDNYKKRNEGRSPDFADSLALSFARSSHVPKKNVVDMWGKKRRMRKAGFVV